MEFLKIWEILLRRKWIILIVAFGFFFSVVAGTYLIRPTYKSRAKLLVETSDTLSSLLSTIGLSSKSQTSSPSSSSTTSYDTEIALATIRPLMEEVITTLKLKNRKGEPMKADKLADANFLLTLLRPQPYIDVDQYGDADMIEIVAYSPAPKEAANMANKLAEIYIRDTVQRNTKEYTAARVFIEARIKDVKADYLNSLVELKDFKIANNTVDVSYETQVLVNKISQLNSDYETNEKTIIELDRSIAEAKGKLKGMDQYRKESQEFVKSEQLKALETKLNELVLSMTEKSVDFTSEHPDYKKLEKQVETAKNLQKKEALLVLNNEKMNVDPTYDDVLKKMTSNEIDREACIAKRKLYKKFIDVYQSKLMKIPSLSSEDNKLQLALSVNKDVYQKLLEYLVEISLAESMTLSNIRLVESATEPEEAYFPKKLLNFVLGGIMALFWGLAVGFLVEYTDNTIKSPEELKKIKSLPFLGSVPFLKLFREKNIISDLSPTEPAVEVYRTIRNSLKYASVDRQIRTIMVTSSVANEGKSSFAANLAVTFGMEDIKVILVDLDLRNPTMRKFFQTKVPPDANINQGVTNIIAEGMELQKAIIHSTIRGLDLLMSGPVPPDPSRLIESNKVKDIIEALKADYDLVIIDTPPVIAVNDGIVIGRIVDGVLYMIESGRIAFSMVEHSKEMMDKAGINLIGVVLNKFKVYKARYYGYYYGYYHQKK